MNAIKLSKILVSVLLIFPLSAFMLSSCQIQRQESLFSAYVSSGDLCWPTIWITGKSASSEVSDASEAPEVTDISDSSPSSEDSVTSEKNDDADTSAAANTSATSLQTEKENTKKEVTEAQGKTDVSDDEVKTIKRALRVLAIGDSICYGGRNSHKGFVGDLGLPYLNMGQNGATLSTKEKSVTNIPDQLDKVSNYTPDIIVADGGINDYIYNVPMGKIPTKKLSDVNLLSEDDLATVMGGLQKLFILMKTKYPDAQRYFVITHKTTYRLMTKVNGKFVYTEDDRLVDLTVTANKAGYTQKGLHDAIVACCKVYDVKVIDIYKKSSLNTANADYRSKISYMEDPSATENDYVDIDGVHPLERGYLKYYLPIMRKYIKSDSQVYECPVEIVVQPTSTTAAEGESITLSLKAIGKGLKYAWYFRKAGQESFSLWKGRIHDTETVTPNASWNGIQLYCEITDSSGNSVQSDIITVTIQ